MKPAMQSDALWFRRAAHNQAAWDIVAKCLHAFSERHTLPEWKTQHDCTTQKKCVERESEDEDPVDVSIAQLAPHRFMFCMETMA